MGWAGPCSACMAWELAPCTSPDRCPQESGSSDNVDRRMLSSRLHTWCCLFFQGLLWLWQDTQDPRWQSWCCTYTSMILTEGDFFYERKICFKTLLCCTPGIRPDVRAPQPAAGIKTQQSRVSMEVQPWRGMMKGLLQSEVRYHPVMQELFQLFYLVVSSSVSPAITQGAHKLPQRPGLTEP